MPENYNDLRIKLEQLKEKIKQPKFENDKVLSDEIRKIYVEIANGLRVYEQLQEELKNIAHDFKKRRSSQTDVGRFYSFVKSRTSAELDIATLLDRAWNLIVVEDYDEAVKVLKKSLDIDPRNLRALGLMALALMHREKYDQAMMFLQQVLTSEPNNFFALNNLGYICYKKGIWGEAIEHLSKAAKQSKDRMAALYANYYLGLVYLERSMIPDAVRFFDEALKIGPNLQEAYYHLGLAETKRYEFKKAIEYFEKCIALDQDSKFARMSKNDVAKIKPLVDPKKILNIKFQKNNSNEKMPK